MIDFNEAFTYVLSEVKQKYECYVDEPEKFIKTSIKKYSEDISVINDTYEILIDDLNDYIYDIIE
jgi:hypothetical protein